MLIYNHKKEFIGIDANDLEALGYANLEELTNEVEDFAELFVKTPGYVHNFQHVSWIDFVSCAESTESTKVIIHANAKDYRCLLEIQTIYLTEEPTKKAYQINLNQMRQISLDKLDDLGSPIPTPQTRATAPIQDLPVDKEQLDELEEIAEAPRTVPIDFEPEPSPIPDTAIDIDILDFDNEEDSSLEIKEETQIHNLTEEDFKIDLEEEEEVSTPIQEPLEIEEEQTVEEIYDNGYIYDPQVASDELGLPVDLIEEFIEDFIAQAKEFKDGLYTAFNDGEDGELKALSHKLKGVAANLRIEDALEHLVVVNTSDNRDAIKENLDIFYKIIAKLSGEKIVVTKKVTTTQAATHNNDTAPENETIEFHEDEANEEDDLDIFAPPVEKEALPTEEPLELAFEEIEDDEKLEIKFDENEHEQALEKEIRADIPELADDTFTPMHEADSKEDEELMKIEFEDSDEDAEELQIKLEDSLDEQIQEELAPIQEELKIEFEEEEHPLEEALELEDTLPEIQYDTHKVAGEIGLSQEHFMELLGDYIEEANDLSSDIANAIEENDPTRWKRKAMQLRSMSENMRINDFNEELSTLIQTQDSIEASSAYSNLAKLITSLSKIEG